MQGSLLSCSTSVLVSSSSGAPVGVLPLSSYHPPMSSPYTPEVIAELRSVVADCLTWEEARKRLVARLGITADNVTRMNRRYRFWDTRVTEAKAEAAARSLGQNDAFNVDVQTSKAATVEEVIALCKVDTDVWESKGFNVRRGTKGFAWSARFARKPAPPVDHQLIADLKEDLRQSAPTYKAPRPSARPKDGRLLVVSLFDAHLGKLSWAEQDGENYDLKIAKEVYMRALVDLVSKAQKQGGIARILFPVGNDYLTCDGDDNMTTAGTIQSVDGRFPKIFREARKLLVDAIDYLRQIAPVDVVVIPGNHERSSMFHLGDALECWYHADKAVTIDNLSCYRKYYAFGGTVFGLTHGDTIKQDQLPLLGAAERPDLWAKCKRRVWLLGHYHHYAVKEYVGVQVWVLPSLSGSDGFHQMNGYVGAVRCGVAFLYGENGLEAMFQSEPEN